MERACVKNPWAAHLSWSFVIASACMLYGLVAQWKFLGSNSREAGIMVVILTSLLGPFSMLCHIETHEFLQSLDGILIGLLVFQSYIFMRTMYVRRRHVMEYVIFSICFFAYIPFVAFSFYETSPSSWFHTCNQALISVLIGWLVIETSTGVLKTNQTHAMTWTLICVSVSAAILRNVENAVDTYHYIYHSTFHVLISLSIIFLWEVAFYIKGSNSEI